MKHPLVTLGRTVDWGFLEGRFGEVYDDDPGRPPLADALDGGAGDSSSTLTTCRRRCCASGGSRTPIINTSAGEEFFQHRLVFDRSSLTRWRKPHGRGTAGGADPGSLSVAVKTKAIKPSSCRG